MKIDHLVVNVDPSIQEDQSIIKQIHAMGLPYKPQWGKGTKGFKVSNIWIGQEYFEFVSTPEPLQFRWMFNLLTRTMPWRNAYLPPFAGVPFQFFLQQMNDEKARNYMEQYMVPNSRDEQIDGIVVVVIYGHLTKEDKEIIDALFDDYHEQDDKLTIELGSQRIRFIDSDTYKVEVILNCTNEKHADKEIQLPNLLIRNS